MVRLKPNRKAGRQLGWLVNRSIESYNVQSSKVEFVFAYFYWGMVINPFTGIYTPSVRIPILGWTTIHPYTMLWPWHMCFWHPRKRWKSVSPKCISKKYLKARIKQSWAKVYSRLTFSSAPSFIPTPKRSNSLYVTKRDNEQIPNFFKESLSLSHLVFQFCQREFQDPKMEVLYQNRPYFGGDIPLQYIGLI